MPTLSAELELLVDQALQNVQAIDEELTRIAANFSESLSTGLAAVATDLQDQSVTVTVDVDSALADVQALLELIDESPAAIQVTADTAEALAGVQSLVDAVDAEAASITVDADSTEAQAALDDLSSSADNVATSGEKAQESMHATGLSAGELGGLAGLATGEVKGLGEASGLFGEHAAVAAGGALALGVGITEIAKAGFDAVSAEERFNAALGDQAAAVREVDVGSLSTDLFKLGAQFGSTEAAMQNATSSVFQFAKNSGAGDDEARQFADGIAAISARAVAVNPSVGTTADVMERAAIGIGRARTAASLLNIGLSTTEVNTRAAAIAQDRGEESATAYDKSIAALQIAVEKFGPSLKENIADGAENAANKAKAAKAEFEDALESFAKPLVAPSLDLIKAALPVAVDFGKALADVASVAIPLLTTALKVLGPTIEPVVAGFIAFKAFSLGEALYNSLLLAAAGWGILGQEAATEAAVIKAASIEAAEGEAVATSGLSVVVGIAAAAAVGLGLFGDTADTSGQQVDDFAKSLETANGKLDETATKSALALFEVRHQGDDLRGAGIQLADVLNSTADAGKHQQNVLQDLADVTDKVRVANGSNRLALETYGTTLGDLKGKQAAYIDEIRKGNPELAGQLDALLKENAGNAGVILTLKDLAESHTVVNQKLADRKAIGADVTDQTNQQNDAQSTQNELNKAAFEALTAYATGTGTATDATKALADSQKEENDALKLYKDQLVAIQGVQGDVTAAQIALGNAQQSAFETLVKNGVQFDINTQQGRDNVAALQAQVQAQDALSEAIFKQTGNRDAADASLAGFTQKLEDNLTALTGSKEAADQLLTSLGLVPPAVDPATQSFNNFVASLQDGTFNAQAAADQNAESSGEIKDNWLGDLAAAQAAAAQFGTDLPTATGKAGEDAHTKFKEGADKIPGAAGDAVTNAGGKVTDAGNQLSAQNGPAFGAGTDVGTSFVEGMAFGIDSFAFLVAIAAINAVIAAETAARIAAKSHSPSELFAEIGRDLALGMAGGIDAEAAAVKAASASLVDHAAAGARTAIPAVSGSGSAAAGGSGQQGATVVASTGAAGPVIGQQVNNFNVPVPDPFVATREQAQATRTAMFLAGAL